jgi:hypothetical protein
LHGEGKTRELFGSETRQSHITGAGQAPLSDSAPNWGGTALQYIPNPITAIAQNKRERQRSRKVIFLGVEAADSKIK